jgi:hypothetical protein
MLAPEPHRTTRQPALEPSAEPAFRAAERHKRIRADRARIGYAHLATFCARVLCARSVYRDRVQIGSLYSL